MPKSAERVSRADALRRFATSNALTLAAVAGYLLAFTVAVLAFRVVDGERGTKAMDHFGTAMAEDLAHLAVDPLLRRDRIQLGLLSNRLAARPEVHRIAVYTVDERLFVVAGNLPLAKAPVYMRPVTDTDTIAGDVRVTLDPESFRLSSAELVAGSWQFAVAGLALTLFGFHFGKRAAHRSAASPEARNAPIDDQKTQSTFVVVANLLPQAVPVAADRERLLERGLAIARRVADIYAGQAARLRQGGILLLFPAVRPNDRGFEALCAALLMRRLLDAVGPFATRRAPSPTGPGESPGESPGENSAQVFRYGFDLAPIRPRMGNEAVVASAFSEALLLSSLGSRGDVVIGQAAYDALERPERVHLESLDNPATEALSSGTAPPRGVVRGIGEDYEALLARQSEAVAKAAGPVLRP